MPVLRAGFNNPQGRGADGNDYQFRMRGSPAGSSRDFVESSVPVDLYNVERAEVASGPNSFLFGLGSAGGLVSLTGKKAGLNRDKTTTVHVSYEKGHTDNSLTAAAPCPAVSIAAGHWPA